MGDIVCSDNTGSTLDLCGGGDEDCDPASADGSEDPAVNQSCDGPGDTDLCKEGTSSCDATGNIVCSDNTGSTVDLCGGGDEDCDPASADGSEDPAVNQLCDGPGDSDLCKEGISSCDATGKIVCSDTTGSTLDLCGGGDEDCDPASADGDEDPLLNTSCDGMDSDMCLEGTYSCVSGGLSCSDTTGSTAEICGNSIDDDCDGFADNGCSCSAGTANCDGVAGCECSTGSCCGALCETQHDNGQGQSFYDCEPLNTYNLAQAIKACAAFTGDPASCTDYGDACTGSLGGATSVVCGDPAANADCACWAYAGDDVGYTYNDPMGKGCKCALIGDPTWD